MFSALAYTSLEKKGLIHIEKALMQCFYIYLSKITFDDLEDVIVIL